MVIIHVADILPKALLSSTFRFKFQVAEAVALWNLSRNTCLEVALRDKFTTRPKNCNSSSNLKNYLPKTMSLDLSLNAVFAKKSADLAELMKSIPDSSQN